MSFLSELSCGSIINDFYDYIGYSVDPDSTVIQFYINQTIGDDYDDVSLFLKK